jgi:hypothetical protein
MMPKKLSVARSTKDQPEATAVVVSDILDDLDVHVGPLKIPAALISAAGGVAGSLLASVVAPERSPDARSFSLDMLRFALLASATAQYVSILSGATYEDIAKVHDEISEPNKSKELATYWKRLRDNSLARERSGATIN